MTPQQRGEHGGAVHFYFQGDAAAGRSWGCARGCLPKHRSAALSHSVLSDFRGLLQVLLWVQLIPNSSAFVPLATGHVGETVSYEFWKFAFLVKSMKTSCPKHFWEMQLCQNSLFHESTSNSGKQSHVRKRQWNLFISLNFFFFLRKFWFSSLFFYFLLFKIHLSQKVRKEHWKPRRRGMGVNKENREGTLSPFTFLSPMFFSDLCSLMKKEAQSPTCF